ncbi:MAG: serine/threonine-protein kinase, partial [Planctomycetota bacterium]
MGDPVGATLLEKGSTVWGDFEIHFDRELGRGGMGAVYRARQISLDREVAVKVLEPRDSDEPPVVNAFLEKFLSESRSLARLNDSRIVQVIQAGRNEDRFWFAMELVEGETVEDLLTREGAFSGKEAARVAAEVARALDTASRQGIVHRDVKPGNIFIADDGAVKVADWGLSKTVGAAPGQLTILQQIACTPAYASPEQATGKECDFRSDLYSLGCVLYEMLCECAPFHSDSPMELLFKQCHDEVRPPSLLNPAVSQEMEAVVLRCLAKKPDERYASYADLVGALEGVREEPEEEPKPAKSRTALILLSAAALALTLGVVAFAVHLLDEAPAPEPKPVVHKPEPVAEPEPERPPVAEMEEPEEEAKLPEGVAPPEVRPAAVAQVSPSREETVEAYFANHETTPEEAAALRTLMKLCVEGDDAVERFAASEEISPFVRVIAEHTAGQGPSAEDLFRKLDRHSEEYDPQALYRVVGVLQRAALETLESGDPGPAEKLIALVDGNKALVPESLAVALEVRGMLKREIAAVEALARFHEGAFKDVLGRGQAYSWEPVPRWDKEREAFLLRSDEGTASMSRAFDAAPRGLRLRFSFEARSPASTWAVSLTERIQLQFGEKDGRP